LGTILLSAVPGIWRFCMVIRSLLPISLETTHDPKEPVFLIALRIMRHAMLCLSVITFLICVCWHPERMCLLIPKVQQHDSARKPGLHFQYVLKLDRLSSCIKELKKKGAILLFRFFYSPSSSASSPESACVILTAFGD